MIRPLCAIVFFAAAGVGFADDTDPVKEKLNAAKVAYDAELTKYRKDVGEWLDKREEAARKDGNKKVVDQIKAERATFDGSGELPKTIPANIRQKPGLAKKTLEAAYAEAVREYTKIKKDTEAAAVELEGEAFMKEPVGAPAPGGAAAPGGAGAPVALSGYLGRTGEAKAKLLKEGGGNEESEKAVALGLAWVASQQQKDGSWEYDMGSKEHKAAATGMALLAFLAAGETHTDATAKHKNTVKKGLDYLVKNCPAAGANAGRISVNAYEQAIATIPLCEAYGMTNDPKLKPVAQAAINYIQKSQGPNGSWGYTSGINGDTSIVGWQIQALYAAKQAKLAVDDRVIKKAVKFLDSAAGGAKKSMYGYADNTGAAPGTALTAIGLYSRNHFDAWDAKHIGMIDGVQGLVKNPPIGSGQVRNMYYYYYATQLLRHLEGEEWVDWNEGPKVEGVRKGGMRQWLAHQQITKDGNNKGSWDPEGGWFGSSCGRLGTTCMCVLTLEVYYRYPPSAAAPPAGKVPKDK